MKVEDIEKKIQLMNAAIEAMDFLAAKAIKDSLLSAGVFVSSSNGMTSWRIF